MSTQNGINQKLMPDGRVVQLVEVEGSGGGGGGDASAANQLAQIAQIGEVQASPTANTVLDRLKTLAGLLTQLPASLGAKLSSASLSIVQATDASMVVASTGGVIDSPAQQVLAFTSASAQSAAVNAATTRAVLVSTQDCWVSWGSSPTAAVATAGNIFLPAGIPSYPIAVTSGTTKFAAIRVSSDGSLSILESR